MNVQLTDYTGHGHADPADWAATMLIFAKSTRLEMRPTLLDEIAAWPAERKQEELRAIANTIPSCWEFVDYTFLITDVTRAFTHQFVRTRHASFAQQTMRVLNVNGWDYATGPTVALDAGRTLAYDTAMRSVAATYQSLINDGTAVEDARGVLPTNILTNILVKMNLRTFAEMVRKRSSSRVQGEYRDVLKGMKDAVAAVHPWVSFFVERTFDKAADELDAAINALPIEKDQRTAMVKLLDQMRMQS